MKALKKLERMRKAVEELRSIVAMLLKEEQVGPSSEIRGDSRRPLGDSAKEKITEKVPDPEAADNADLLIMEVSELLGRPMEERSAKKNSILESEENPRNHEHQSSAELAREDTEDSNKAGHRRDFWFSLAHQRIRI